jgi:oligopeptide transport system permease protein
VQVDRLHFFFGTDAIGRDLVARTLIGVRISLAIGVLASLMALTLGVAYGAVSGYLGGKVDAVMMRIVDILYSLPFIFFVILMVVFFGRSILIIFIAIGATEWLDMARIVRGQTLSLKRQEFVQAAEALGASRAGILMRHVIPNTLGPVIVFVTLLVPKAILLESLLSFLGLGVQEPLTSLGLLISEGASNMRGAPWLLIWPALTLTAILFALNFLGDGLRDSLDPKDR